MLKTTQNQHFFIFSFLLVVWIWGVKGRWTVGSCSGRWAAEDDISLVISLYWGRDPAALGNWYLTEVEWFTYCASPTHGEVPKRVLRRAVGNAGESLQAFDNSIAVEKGELTTSVVNKLTNADS